MNQLEQPQKKLTRLQKRFAIMYVKVLIENNFKKTNATEAARRAGIKKDCKERGYRYTTKAHIRLYIAELLKKYLPIDEQIEKSRATLWLQKAIFDDKSEILNKNGEIDKKTLKKFGPFIKSIFQGQGKNGPYYKVEFVDPLVAMDKYLQLLNIMNPPDINIKQNILILSKEFENI